VFHYVTFRRCRKQVHCVCYIIRRIIVI
jgi:hypothetical protein